MIKKDKRKQHGESFTVNHGKPQAWSFIFIFKCPPQDLVFTWNLKYVPAPRLEVLRSDSIPFNLNNVNGTSSILELVR